MELTPPRFSPLPMLLLAVAFSLAAPLFWIHVETAAPPPGAPAIENPELYGRVLPSLQYGYQRMAGGEWPLWAPGQFCGMPFFANPTLGMLAPLNAVFYVLPPLPGLAMHAFIGLFLMALFAALFLRALGAGWIPAALGGCAYAFCGTSAAAMSRPEMLGVLAFAPLLHWIAFAWAARSRGPLLPAGGAVIAMMILAGSLPLALLFTASACACGTVSILARPDTAGARYFQRLRGLAIMGGLGLAYAAAAWIPAAAWLASLESPWAALWPQSWSVQLPAAAADVPAHILGATAGPRPGVLYAGAIALILAPAALLNRNRRLEVLCLLALAAFCLAIAVRGGGSAQPASPWMAFLFPGALAIALLAGLGADRILLTGRDPRSPLIWGAVLICLAAAGIVLAAGAPAARGAVALALLVLLPFFILRVRWLGTVCGLLLLFLHYADLRNAAASAYLHPYAGSPNWLQDSLPAVKEAEAQALGQRVLALPSARESILPANIGLMQPLASAGGAWWPLTPDQARWWDRIRPHMQPAARFAAPGASGAGDPADMALLNYMAVRVVLGERNQPWMDNADGGVDIKLRFLRTVGRLSLWKNESALPRARWVPQWRPVSGIEEAMNTLLSPDFDGASSVTVEASGKAWEALRDALAPAGAPAGEGDPGASVHLRHESHETVEVRVESPRPGILVLADSYDPGWQARVNGKRAPILRVNGLFRGLYLPEGAHTVVFTYTPASVTIGLLVTGASLLITLVWGAFSLARIVIAMIRGNRGPSSKSAPAMGGGERMV
ncbi:MAG: YfhO family protein [Candidatus Hydrogenedentes bacterium]|nr:YfhO family protein [Candidatus Hydrogenedentota bacterium]